MPEELHWIGLILNKSALPRDIVLREAKTSDAQLLYEWVNSADSLAASLITSNPIPWDEHCDWLATKIADPGSIIWIAKTGGQVAGSIRLVTKSTELEIAIYVDPAMRKSGIALSMLKKARETARADGMHLPLIARILRKNKASLRLFEKAGYRFDKDHADHIVLRLNK